MKGFLDDLPMYCDLCHKWFPHREIKAHTIICAKKQCSQPPQVKVLPRSHPNMTDDIELPDAYKVSLPHLEDVVGLSSEARLKIEARAKEQQHSADKMPNENSSGDDEAKQEDCSKLSKEALLKEIKGDKTCGGPLSKYCDNCHRWTEERWFRIHCDWCYRGNGDAVINAFIERALRKTGSSESKKRQSKRTTKDDVCIFSNCNAKPTDKHMLRHYLENLQ